MKRCTGPCGRELEEAEFYVKDKKSGRRFARCKQCHCKQTNADYHGPKNEARKAQRKEYATAHRPDRAAQMRAWRAKNHERAAGIGRKHDQRRQADPERRAKKRLYGATYRQKHADQIDAYNATYREQRVMILRLRCRAWRAANPERAKEIVANWKRANRATVNAATHRRKAILKGCEGTWTAEEWNALKEAQDFTCLMCGCREPEIKLTPDHVKPLVAGGDNTILNIQGLCGSCNSSKCDAEIELRDERLLDCVADIAGRGCDVSDIEPVTDYVAALPPLKAAADIPIFGNRKQWQHLDDTGLAEYATRIMRHYREQGYPHYRLTDEQKWGQIDNLLNYVDRVAVTESDGRKTILAGNHALGLCWSYFPHAAGVRCHNRRTPLETFGSDLWFHKALVQRLKRGDYITDSGVRKGIRSASGVQAVSNFRPAAAVAVYKHFHRDGKLTVWDMSAGYGGRLLGAWASGVVGRYIGTDPCEPTYAGLCAMRDELAEFGVLPAMQVELHKCGSEVLDLPAGSVDLCFTSPPYFATEDYGTEPEQSHRKFGAYQDWLEGFLKATMMKCRQALKPHGSMVLNVANVAAMAPTLEADTVAVAESCGFKLVDTLYLALSHLTKGGHKFEPVFVFAK
jgi:hypothetical protein